VGINGEQKCSDNLKCNWETSGNISTLKKSYNDYILKKSHITVSVYNVHALWHKLKKKYPPNCDLPTDLTLGL
jgi:hypothetical protein